MDKSSHHLPVLASAMTPNHVDDKTASLHASLRAELSPKLSAPNVLSLSSSAEFLESDLRFTQWQRPTYIAAVRPTCEQDVVQTIDYARTKGIPMAARSGHHCVTATMGRLRDGILLDMRSIKHMEFDADKAQITIGGGTILDDFTKYVHSLKMEVTVGSCPTTGIMGISFGAGLGRLQGKYGYLNDSMVSCKMVLADGSATLISQETNPDLFWAIRGAGHNFGIAIEATFQLYPQTNGGIHHCWDLGFEIEKTERLFELLNHVHLCMPADLAIFVLWKRIFPTGEKNLILINLVYHGPESEASKWVSMFDDLGPTFRGARMSMPWPDLPWEACAAQNKLLARPEIWRMTPWKGMSALNIKEFHPPTMRLFFQSLKDMNEKYSDLGWFGAMFECFPNQRTREISSDATAFPWRHGGDHQLMISATPKDAADLPLFTEYLENWQETFLKVSGFGRLHQYVNYGNTTSKKDPVEALYGYEPWRLQKLRALKTKYDAKGFFSWYQPFM